MMTIINNSITVNPRLLTVTYIVLQVYEEILVNINIFIFGMLNANNPCIEKINFKCCV